MAGGGARGLLSILAALLLATGCRRDEAQAIAAVPEQPAPALEAPRASGGMFRLSEQRGKVVLLSFGYTACPDVCPTTLSQLRRVYEQLGAAARDVEVVFVSVDPERDSAERLETYVHAFHPRFTGLRLEGDALAAVLSGYRVTASRRYPDATRYREHRFAGDIPYTVDHTGAYFLIDKRGVLRERLPYSVPAGELRAGVERLLAEREPRASVPGVRVEGALARLTPARVGAVYFTLVNTAGREDRLVSAEASSAGRVELHEVVAEGEVLRMLPRPEGFGVPAGGRVELKPGGKHLMLYSVQGSPGSIHLTLHFERAGAVQLTVPASGPGADGP
ncbi:SCO family protein [Archangium lipolyticum]|uniref:SCO family protein n=1 Tax=Archangium lipolyticum TaxID=2970465 RepID=UPI002149F208|nr:SCO family protein [Archangium lipolyticum]